MRRLHDRAQLAGDTFVRGNALSFWSLTGMAPGVGTRRIVNTGP